MEKTLIIGYGNPDRQDDGVAWHVLNGIVEAFGCSELLEQNPESVHIGENLDLLYLLQLVPELSEQIAQYQKVCFVDAHTGDIPEMIRIQEIQPKFHRSPFTHHITPETLLEICQTIYHASPKAMLASIRGFEFGFSDELSDQTKPLVAEAITQILSWIKD